MKVLILCGGFGTRIRDVAEDLPKPMIPVGDRPILWHIMNTYSKYGYKEFYLALGHKSEVVKEYFLNYYDLNSDFTVNLRTGKTNHHQKNYLDWKVTLLDTGKSTMTGGRVKRLKKYIGNEPFFLTYGDGVSNVNIDDLLKFHRGHNKMITMTAVRPPARFGELELNEKGMVKSFKEKPQMHKGWINGGFFVVEPEFIELIDSDETLLEREPLEKAAEINELMAFKHEGFWQCMDTMRDKQLLEKLWNKGDAPWE